jgi:hypothetical protein
VDVLAGIRQELIGMGSKVVPLGLDQVGWQPRRPKDEIRELLVKAKA